MSKQVERLSDRTCRAACVGMHHDGRGLYLQCRQGVEGVTKSWLLRYTLDGKQTWMGLGPYPDISLSVARRKAQDARALKADGRDPLAAKHSVRACFRQRQTSPSVTFDQAARAYHDSHSAAWRNPLHARQWLQTLVDHVFPTIGSVPVDQIDTQAILRVLTPIWSEKPVTASRVRGRIEVVLDAEKVRGHRDGENPCRWRGHLDKLLLSPDKVARVEHFASLPYREIASFVRSLRQQDAVAARALEMIILCARRAGEVLGMTWAEVDFDAKLWVIPARRMKGHREHRAPLSDQAIAVLKRIPRTGDDVFPCSLAALDKLRRQTGLGVTTHGFRATFKTWASEETSYPTELIEECLAHATGNATERAYRRSDWLEKRRALMQAWADYCDRQSAEVIALRA